MGNPIVDVQKGLEALHSEYQAQDKGGWREVGKLLKISGAYAYQLAKGKRPIITRIERSYLELNRPSPTPARVRTTVGISGLHPETRAAHDARRNGRTWDQYMADMLQESHP